MGCYVNLGIETKSSYLAKEGKLIGQEEAFKHKDFTENFVVVLVDNGFFEAAGICYSQEELDAWRNDYETGDRRPKKYYVVPKEKLVRVSDLEDYLKQEEV